ncbi:hypothetical protein MMC14_007851 [Varicellaria rhodocarpa]|nr:hypothetical protein [Varicellaria rhodocarpa]
MRPMCCLKHLPRKSQPISIVSHRSLATATTHSPSRYRTPPPYPPRPSPSGIPSVPIITTPYRIKTYPPLPSARSHCPVPLQVFADSQLSLLDPTGARRRLFSRTNPDAAHVGDILLVRFKTGEPFAGVCMNIRRRGVDTGILLRAQLTRVGTEMWVKVFSPTVVGVEVVQRVERRVRRARAYYFRKPKHDRGNLQGIVDHYLRTRSLLRSNSTTTPTTNKNSSNTRGKTSTMEKGKGKKA